MECGMKEEMVLLEKEISNLPSGSITEKKINGGTYYYHRWYEGGKRKEKYVSGEDAKVISEQIKHRKELERRLKDLEKQTGKHQENEFSLQILTGEELRRFVDPVLHLKRRECFSQLDRYIHNECDGRIAVLYGLRRTGKTTLIRQEILSLDEKDFKTAAFIHIAPSDKLSDLTKDLRKLSSLGYLYIFIDEITLLEDFIESSAFLADIYASSGMKIVLSGTDSLGFVFAEDEQLYDRCIMIHTTYIPYREFSYTLGLEGIDTYIRYGGTMSISGVNYNNTSPFSDIRRTDDYIDTAIAKNIQHSLRFYQDEGHFHLLYDLYEKNELTNAINRVVEDINHRFTVEVITRDFKSNDLALSRRNLMNDRINPSLVLAEIDDEVVAKRISDILDIKNKEFQSVKVSPEHAEEIKEYLKLLDLIYEIPVKNASAPEKNTKRIVITQPGLRYAQSDALIESLLDDSMFKDLSVIEKDYIINRIRGEIKGRMMEDIVLLETALAYPGKEVFVLQFPVGEFDMVVFDREALDCEIFEIKHSDKTDEKQYRHIIDEEKCSLTEFQYGRIKGRYVIYRGPDTLVDRVQYVNVESYLKNIRRG